MQNKSFWKYFFSNIGLAVITLIITGIYIFGTTLIAEAMLTKEGSLSGLIAVETIVTVAVCLAWYKAFKMWEASKS